MSIRLRWFFLTLALALVSNPFEQASIANGQEAKATIAIKAATDRDHAIYQVGETATFSIEATNEGKPLLDGTIVCVLSKDGVQPQLPQTIVLKDGKATVQGKLEEPGFLLLRATIGKTTALASAGYDPLQLKPSMRVPEDFDSFWAAQKSALAAIPALSRLTPVEPPSKGLETFDMSRLPRCSSIRILWPTAKCQAEITPRNSFCSWRRCTQR